MKIQDAKQAQPHCRMLIAELLDSRRPKTEREHAAAREIERLRDLCDDNIRTYSLPDHWHRVLRRVCADTGGHQVAARRWARTGT